MDLENFIDSTRIEAFYDAVIAIIITVLVLELPQPASPTIMALWDIRAFYLAYLISFIICANMWIYNHKLYENVRHVDYKIIILILAQLLLFSVIPYLTIFVANNFNYLLPQLLYGIDFILVDILLIITNIHLNKINGIDYTLSSLIKPYMTTLVLFAIGIMVGLLGYPELIIVLCVLSIPIPYLLN